RSSSEERMIRVARRIFQAASRDQTAVTCRTTELGAFACCPARAGARASSATAAPRDCAMLTRAFEPTDAMTGNMSAYVGVSSYSAYYTKRWVRNIVLTIPSRANVNVAEESRAARPPRERAR